MSSITDMSFLTFFDYAYTGHILKTVPKFLIEIMEMTHCGRKGWPCGLTRQEPLQLLAGTGGPLSKPLGVTSFWRQC